MPFFLYLSWISRRSESEEAAASRLLTKGLALTRAERAETDKTVKEKSFIVLN